MKYNVWGINYAPELTGIGVYNAGLCEFLSAHGHDVRMVTAFPYYPAWKKQESDVGQVYRSEERQGVHVYRCWLYVPSRPSVLKRMVYEASFIFTSFWRQLALPAPDLYVIVSHPLLLGFAAWIVSRLKGTPYVFHVQDMQPDAALQLNMLKPGLFISILRWFERLAYDKAAAVSGISAEMCRAFQSKGVPASKIVQFPNWVQIPRPEELPAPGTWKRSRSLDEGTQIVSYAGNMGVKQGLELILEAAKLCEANRSILFVIAGDGADRARLEALAGEWGLTNVRFEPVLPEDEHTALLADSDLCLITMKRGTGAAFLPSKLLKILALERPIVTNADAGSALYNAVIEGQFGRVVDPEDSAGLAGAVLEMVKNPAERRQMGSAGLRFVSQFSENNVLTNYEEVLARIVAGEPAIGPLSQRGCR